MLDSLRPLDLATRIRERRLALSGVCTLSPVLDEVEAGATPQT